MCEDDRRFQFRHYDSHVSFQLTILVTVAANNRYLIDNRKLFKNLAITKIFFLSDD